jgi:hypothetical protein
MSMRNRFYGVERLDLGDGLRYVGVYVPGHPPQYERITSFRWWVVHCRAALLAWRIKKGRL